MGGVSGVIQELEREFFVTICDYTGIPLERLTYVTVFITGMIVFEVQ
jgi:hypothetical protein